MRAALPSVLSRMTTLPGALLKSIIPETDEEPTISLPPGVAAMAEVAAVAATAAAAAATALRLLGMLDKQTGMETDLDWIWMFRGINVDRLELEREEEEEKEEEMEEEEVGSDASYAEWKVGWTGNGRREVGVKSEAERGQGEATLDLADGRRAVYADSGWTAPGDRRALRLHSMIRELLSRERHADRLSRSTRSCTACISKGSFAWFSLSDWTLSPPRQEEDVGYSVRRQGADWFPDCLHRAQNRLRLAWGTLRA
ncbi:hypothetical protein L1887_49924 [Cichorium endivia]|nr:hypothetical protein L1887_49924 [Cichorium endivia]